MARRILPVLEQAQEFVPRSERDSREFPVAGHPVVNHIYVNTGIHTVDTGKRIESIDEPIHIRSHTALQRPGFRVNIDLEAVVRKLRKQGLTLLPPVEDVRGTFGHVIQFMGQRVGQLTTYSTSDDLRVHVSRRHAETVVKALFGGTKPAVTT